MVILLYSVASYGQISPGDLSQPHADLEGMTNCTQCHELGEKVTNQKCLECHSEIQTLLNNREGFHSNSTVINKDCFECHSEHHGRKFDMVRFDEDSFDHLLTGYELEGKHEVIDCRTCHVSENIVNPELKNRKETFLGLDQECLSCHDDYHQESLSQDCASCHNIESFSPAVKFDHDDTSFALEGKHIDVDCLECHPLGSRNGEEFQEFSGIASNDCKACHDDPHTNQIKGQCLQCHTESSFSTFVGQDQFNHNNTGFTLKGKHKSVDCFSCHTESNNPRLVFQDNINIDENNCIECHADQHEGKFGSECVKCHNEKSFFNLNDMDFFDHTLTDYPLEGKHMEVDCKQCHTGRLSETIDFSACNKCHSDYHQEEFIKENNIPDCIECHTLQDGFEYSLYTLEQHETSSFPLEGAHNATPCFACHVSEEEDRWTFRNLGNECIDCHQDFHDGYISETYYPDKSCTSCHINDSWAQVNFDHNQTKWPLEGKHTEVDCRACHFVEISDNNAVTSQIFTNLGTDCMACHENIHGESFAINGVTDCKRCHITSSWLPENFDHNTTPFPLEGKHAEIECRACHTSSLVNGQTEILYKINKFECIDCHR